MPSGAGIQEYLDRQVVRRAVLVENREVQVHQAGARYVVVRAEVLRRRADLRVDVVVYLDDLCVLVETAVVIHLAPEVIDAVADVLEVSGTLFGSVSSSSRSMYV